MAEKEINRLSVNRYRLPAPLYRRVSEIAAGSGVNADDMIIGVIAHFCRDSEATLKRVLAMPVDKNGELVRRPVFNLEEYRARVEEIKNNLRAQLYRVRKAMVEQTIAESDGRQFERALVHKLERI